MQHLFGIPIMNKNIIMSSFKSSRDIQKKEDGPDSSDCTGGEGAEDSCQVHLQEI